MRDTKREGQRHRQREKQAPCREPDVGLNPRIPGSCPGLKAGTKPLSHPGIPLLPFLWWNWVWCLRALHFASFSLSSALFSLLLWVWLWGRLFYSWATLLIVNYMCPGIPGWLSGLVPAFSPGRDPGVPGLNPTSGSLHGTCFSLCLCLCLSLSMSIINK